MPVPSRSQFRAETRWCWTRSGQQKTGLNRLRSHLNCWDPSRCRCWVSTRWMDCPAYLPFQQARRAGLQNGQSRLSGGIPRSDRESSEVTSNPDPTRGLGALRSRSDAAPPLAAVAVANSFRSQRPTPVVSAISLWAQHTDPGWDCLQYHHSRNHKKSGPCARGMDVGLEPGFGCHGLRWDVFETPF